MGPSRLEASQRLAGNLLRLARLRRGLTQRQLADLASVPQSTIGRIETYRQQPTLPLLAKLLAAADLELRTRIEDYDRHDDVLDAELARMSEAQRRRLRRAQDRFAAAR
ncbi:MAG TPA: helix-turn-helix transcriptional regulator [Mycobacteriales bacterium]|nr:helix-turn-helix transcriptional regulator [Mycobacteriales bacterium]